MEGDIVALALLDLSSEDSDDSSVEESSEFEQFVQDILHYNDCLFGLGHVLRNPPGKVVSKADVEAIRTESIQASSSSIAQPFIAIVLESYPSIDKELARRLGEANHARYERLRVERETHAAVAPSPSVESDSTSEEAAGASQQPESPRVDSTVLSGTEDTTMSTELSSLFDKFPGHSAYRARSNVPKPPASLNTFASSTSSTRLTRRLRGIPKMPADRPWGEPFPCTLCGQTLSNVWSSAQWV